MKFSPQKYVAKNSTEVEIRELKPSEADKLLNLKLDYLKNTSTIPIVEGEYKNDLKAEEALIHKYNQSPNSILLVAIAQNECIGNIDLTGNERQRMYHTRMIGMGVNNYWRNQGIGSMLLQSTLNWAENNDHLEVIWLDVYANNELGLSIYKKMGFEISGVIKGFFRDGDRYLNLLVTMNNLWYMRLTEKNITAIARYLADKPVKKAYLFGSQNRGDSTIDSDIDILVELDYSQRIGLLFVTMQLDLQELLGKKVDLVSSKGLSKYIKPNVDSEKRLIYAR